MRLLPYEVEPRFARKDVETESNEQSYLFIVKANQIISYKHSNGSQLTRTCRKKPLDDNRTFRQ